MGTFRRYRVWERGHALTLRVYHATNGFPDSERYGLVSQMRRAAASIPINIAEGFGRSGDRERARFVDIAIGSAYELEYQTLLSRDLGFLGTGEHDAILETLVETRKMLATLLRKLRADVESGRLVNSGSSRRPPTADG